MSGDKSFYESQRQILRQELSQIKKKQAKIVESINALNVLIGNTDSVTDGVTGHLNNEDDEKMRQTNDLFSDVIGYFSLKPLGHTISKIELSKILSANEGSVQNFLMKLDGKVFERQKIDGDKRKTVWKMKDSVWKSSQNFSGSWKTFAQSF